MGQAASQESLITRAQEAALFHQITEKPQPFRPSVVEKPNPVLEREKFLAQLRKPHSLQAVNTEVVDPMQLLKQLVQLRASGVHLMMEARDLHALQFGFGQSG